MTRVLAWPDTHCPWDHPKARDFLCRVRDHFKCDRIVNLGDEVDMAAFSTKWPVSPDMPSASRELELAIESLERYYKVFPNVDVIESNHGIRIFKKAMVSGLPRMVIKRYEEILHYPSGWKLVGDHLLIDGVQYIHGDPFNGNNWIHAHSKMKSSVVLGHLHSRAGVYYSKTRKGSHFAMNCGALVDPDAPAFLYAKHMIEKPVLGCGVIIDGEQAMFIPMNSQGKFK